MIIKSLIILSLLFNSVGLHGLSAKFDDAVVRDRAGSKKVADAAFNFNLGLPDILPRPQVKEGALKASVNAKEYLLVDADSGVVLAQNGKNTKVPIASTTKIMTAIIALEDYKLSDIANISTDAVNQVPSIVYLRTGEQITIENLLYSLLIPSGNDAAYAIAEHMNGPEDRGIEKFIAKMNEKAKELGMDDTHYEDPAGLDSTGYSTAYDLFVITKYALRNPIFRQVVAHESYTAKNVDSTIYHALKQSNRLITENYMGALGVKTGFTPEAGHCLVGAATRDGHTLISIVLNTFYTTPDASAIESKRLLDWGFQNTDWN